MSLKAVLFLEEACNTDTLRLYQEKGLRVVWITDTHPPDHNAILFKTSCLSVGLDRPETYAQIIALIGVEPDEVLVVGNEPSYLDAAQAIGLSKQITGRPLREELAPFVSMAWKSCGY